MCRWVGGIALSLLCLAAPQRVVAQADDAPPDEAGADGAASAAIDAVYDRFSRAYRMAEPDSVVALYTEDALYLPAGGDVRRGKEALRAEFGFLEAIGERGGRPHITFEEVDRSASGDLAYDVGYYRLVVEAADGTRGPPSRGKFATVWKRGADGQWRIHVDSFSPAPEAENGTSENED